MAVLSKLCLKQRNLAEFSPDLAEFGPDLAEFGPDLAEFGPDLAEFGPDLAEFGPELALFGPELALFGLGQFRENSAFYAVFFISGPYLRVRQLEPYVAGTSPLAAKG